MLKFSNRRGQATILFTLGLTTMVGMVGLAVDIGWSYYREQAAQAAAEAAAMAAVAATVSASPLTTICGVNGAVCQSATVCPDPIPNPPTNNFHTACHYAKDNGFTTTSTSNDTVVIAANTTASPVNGLATSYWVTATVTSRQPQGFSAIMGNLMGVVSARATAVVLPSPASCIYVLNPTVAGALSIAGTTSVTAPCGAFVNSSNAAALQVSGGGCLNATPSAIRVVGNYSGSCISPAPTTNASAFADPLGGVPAPAWSGCDHVARVNLSGGIQILSPGVYCGGIGVSGTTILTLLPGTYILNGGGLAISGSNVTVIGTGVTFYNTADGTHPYGVITVSGGAAIALRAPTSGAMNNILFFEDRAITSASDHTISGGSTSIFSGVLYFRNSRLLFAGNSVSLNVAIVADRVTFTGTSRISGGTNAGTTTARIALVE